MNKDYTALSDEELLIELSLNNTAAFDEIYKRYWSNMFTSAYNILREREDCMDVVQEIFVWLWEKREQVVIRSLKSYLLVAVKFKVANYLRNGKVRNSFFEQLKGIEHVENLVENDYEVNELAAIIADFTKGLPEKCREIFELSRYEHLSNKEIAERLGISVKTVENQISIAIKKLRGSMSKITSFFILF